MLVPIFQILYGLVFLTILLMGIFIIFHIVSFSYTATSKMMMLLIFVPVAGVLLFTNFLLFANLPLAKIFSGLMP